MPMFTEEELRELEADPKTAAVAKKLREGNFIPKERFDEVNDKKKQLEEAEQTRRAKQREWEQLAAKLEEEKAGLARQVETEKAIADQHRTYLAGTKEKAKAALGARWLGIYENASLEDLDKILARSSTREHEQLLSFFININLKETRQCPIPLVAARCPQK